MLKRAKILNIICSVAVSLVLVLLALAGLVLGRALFSDSDKLVIKSGSDQKIYDGVPLTLEDYEIAHGELETGHTLDISFSGIQLNAGHSDNTFYVTIRDELGMDVTDTYNLELEYGTLEVMPKPLKIIPGSAQKFYDGEPLTCSEWSYSPSNALLPNHYLEVEVVGEITEVGMVMNIVGSATVYNESGKNVSYNYDITYEYGMLMVIGEGGFDGMIGMDGLLNLSGDILGNTLPNLGENVVCYQVKNQKDDTVYLKIKSFGEYKGGSWKDATEYSSLISQSCSADYLTGSGLNQSFAKIEILALNGQYALPYYLRRTSTAGYEPTASDVYYVGNTDKSYKVDYGVYEKDTVFSLPNELVTYEREYRAFVYDQYLAVDGETASYMRKLIEKNDFYGKDIATILAVAEYIQSSAEYNVKYDKALDDEANIAIAFLSEYKEGICQHYATAATLLYRTMGIPARYTVGFVADTVANEWVDVTAKSAHAWVEVYLDGIGWIQVEVTGGGSDGEMGNLKKATLTPVNTEKLYDGTTLYAMQQVTGFEDYEKQGYRLEVTVTGGRTQAGKSQSKITEYVIYDSANNVVTDEFELQLNQGTIHVYLDEIVFSSQSKSKVYDGKALETNVSARKYVKGKYSHSNVKYSFTSNASITSVGSRSADFNVRLTSGGEDITDLYKITKQKGILSVTPVEITVKANDAEKYYDGTPLVSDGYSIIKGKLAKGDKIEHCILSVDQERIEVGRSECIPSDIVIINASGENVTMNYSIKYEEGVLRIHPAS